MQPLFSIRAFDSSPVLPARGLGLLRPLLLLPLLLISLLLI